MLQKKIGFIGGGNMGSAMIGGIISSGLVPPENLIVSARTQETLDRLSARYGIRTTLDNNQAAAESDILFLAVKPNLYESVIKSIRDTVSEQQIIVSIAAGQTLSRIESLFNKQAKLVRTMPNTPAMVLEAMSAVTPNEQMTEEDTQLILSIFRCFGRAEIVPESLMDAVVGVSGSSPAYVYMFIEAMADAAVQDGMPRAQAYTFAAQSVLGAAKMVLETGRHPGELKDAVCSPGGTTIAAVAKLEEQGLRNTVIAAQNTCSEKSRQMSKSSD
ncbi:MAG: pyrroline-5-carboxylate reductase [Lachnospiraceae bacterium]|nr:pyrroline-5-carboxylate reductase [Lachnospiraceae bacterium]